MIFQHQLLTTLELLEADSELPPREARLVGKDLALISIGDALLEEQELSMRSSNVLIATAEPVLEVSRGTARLEPGIIWLHCRVSTLGFYFQSSMLFLLPQLMKI